MDKSSAPNVITKPLTVLGRGAFAIVKGVVFLLLALFLGLVLINFILDTAVQLLQLAILFALILPSVPALYAIDAKHRTTKVRVALGLLSVCLWAAAFFAIYRFG